MKELLLVLIFMPFFCFGQLLINEFSARGGYEDYNGNDCDWVEIINVDSTEINLSDYFLSDDIDNLQKWNLPDEVISQLELILICLSGADQKKTYYHANFKLSYGEDLVISDINGNLIDSKLVNTDLSRVSEGRSSDGSIDWGYFNTPTPGITNDSSQFYENISVPPNISLPSGWYYDQQFVTIISDTLSQIYYTTNGDVPDTNDNLYVDSIFISSTTVLSARSFKSNNYLPSQVIDRTFIFNEKNHNLPVISIITDSLNLWDWESGIYVMGPNADTTSPYSGANFYMPWSKWSRLEFFDKNKQKQAEEEFDLEIHGGSSRKYVQKSFRLDFKSKYTGNLVYPIFSQKPYINKFNNLNLRNGGSFPAYYDRMRDGLISEIAYSTHIDVMGYEPCILYLNGKFWGQYAIREKIDEHYVENNHNLSSDSIDLINRNRVLNGTDIHFIETYHMIMNTEPNSRLFYNLISERFDLKNYIDYFIVETYIQNHDWYAGYNNIKLWRSQNNGKWRYILYDTDQSFIKEDPNINYIDVARNPYYINSNNNTVDCSSMHSELFDRMLMNDEFNCRFITRYSDLVNTIFHPDKFGMKSKELEDKLTSVMPDQIDRWGMPGSITVWKDKINLFSELNEIRAPYALKHVSESFGLDTVTYKTFQVFPPSSGRIRINTVTPDSFPWSGCFFSQPCYSYAIALPEPSYSFTHWDLYRNTIIYQYYHDTLDLSIDSSDRIVANFTNCDSDISLTLNSDTISNFLYPTFNTDYGPYTYSWFLNNVEIIGANDSVYYPIESGYYIVLVGDRDGCYVSSSPSSPSSYFDCDVLMHPILYKNSIHNSLEVMCNEGTDPYSYEWIYYDEIIINSNNYNLYSYSTGVYKVIVTDINGCSSLTDSIIVKNDEVLVYPNPSKSDVNLQFMLVNGSQYNVYISDIKNNILFKEKVSESLSNELYEIKFNLEGLLPGMYFITLESNEYRVIRKLIFYN
jgi:hypothetical protein